MRLIALLVIIFAAAIGIGFFFKQQLTMTADPEKSSPQPHIRYVAIGDSYTIGQGVMATDRWPNLVVDKLRQENLQITLVSNLGISGYTSQDALLKELPQLKEIKPDLVTILLGANDVFQKNSPESFRVNLIELLDETQSTLTNHRNIVLITIPNYSKSPAGVLYGAGESEEKLIKKFNEIIKEEADKRVLPVVDLFPVSDTLTDPKYYVDDGLHPSALGYQEWTKIIYPVMKDHLTNQ